MSEALSIQVVSDFVCPWCYVGKRRLERALESTGKTWDIAWLPFQLTPDMPEEGRNRKEHYDAIFGGKADLIMANMQDTGREEGIEFRYSNEAMSPNTLRAHRLMYWATEAAGIDANALAEKLFAAHHVDCEDLGDVAVLARIAGEVGMDADTMAARLQGDEDKDVVVDIIRQVQSQQVSGVPFFVLNGQLSLSGAQPVDLFAKALRQLEDAAG